MKIILLITSILILTNTAKADLVINTLWKYGVNGYTDTGKSTSSSQSNANLTRNHGVLIGTSSTTSSSVNTLNVDNRYQVTPGIGFEALPHEYGVCIGAGYYFDNTVQMSLGWKLW